MFLLIEKEVIEDSPIAVAQFLHSSTTLDKAKVGEFLSDGGDWNQKILIASRIDLLPVLRCHLEKVHLPTRYHEISFGLEFFDPLGIGGSIQGTKHHDVVWKPLNNEPRDRRNVHRIF